MTLLDERARQVDDADLVVMASVETIRDQAQPATASAVASLIGGAPAGEVYKRLLWLVGLELLRMDRMDVRSVQLTTMGAELLRRELIGWSPSEREERRRDSELARAVSARARGS